MSVDEVLCSTSEAELSLRMVLGTGYLEFSGASCICNWLVTTRYTYVWPGSSGQFRQEVMPLFTHAAARIAAFGC